jgi:integrase
VLGPMPALVPRIELPCSPKRQAPVRLPRRLPHPQPSRGRRRRGAATPQPRHRARDAQAHRQPVPRPLAGPHPDHASSATPPPVPHKDTIALLPEQVDLLLDAATTDPKPWLRAWTVLAAATGARNGELCGLEWSDLDLDQGTIRVRQELTVVNADLLPGHPGSGRRKELAVGPLKSKASKAILSLPPFAVEVLREHRRQQARHRLAGAQPATVTLRWVEPGQPPPVELDLVFRTERGSALNPNHASRGFATLARRGASMLTRTCCVTHSPRRWPPTRSRPASSPRSCATPTAARWPSGSTSTSSPRPPPGGRADRGPVWPGRVGRASGGGKPEGRRGGPQGIT